MKNLFSYATKELSQDAFLRWFLESYDDEEVGYIVADFINYYPRRKAADRIVREEFIRLGGSPRLEHPYSFVMGKSDYLEKWYGDGVNIRLQLDTIPDGQISFTPGDSCARYERNELPVIWTKQMLLKKLHAFGDSQEELIRSIAPYGYVEAQLWDKPGQ